MPEYLSPGVYVEEIDAGPKPIAGVGTSTAGAVGVTLRGPSSGKPKLVTSWSDFERQFGGFVREPDDAALVAAWTTSDDGGEWWKFPMSVKGFFDNGGQRIYIKRVVASGAESSDATVQQGLTITVAQDAEQGGTELKLESLIGLEEGSIFQVVRGDTNAVSVNLEVGSYDATKKTITLKAGQTLPDAVAKGRDFVQVHARTNVDTLEFEARDKGAWGDQLYVHTRAIVGNVYAALPDNPANPVVSTQVTADASAGDQEIEVTSNAGFGSGDHVLIGGIEYALITNPGAGKIKVAAPGLTEDITTGMVVKKLRPSASAGDDKISLWGGRHLYEGAIVELDNGTEKDTFVVGIVGPGDLVELATGTLAHDYYEGHKARLIEAEVIVEFREGEDVRTAETFSNLRLVKDGTASNLENYINSVSKLVTVTSLPGYSETDLTKFPTSFDTPWKQFEDGDDDFASLSVDDFVGTDGGSGARTGIVALEDIDEVALCLAPNMWAGGVHAMLIQHCELLKDRFAILDPRVGLDMEGIQAFRAPIDTKYAALYYPWLNVRDTVLKKTVHLAPSGHMAGIYAQTDVDRGVHKAPANVVVRGIELKDGFAQDITKREQDILNPKSINALRFFPGRGHRVWGARVLTSDSAWKYINVRRLFIMIEESIDEGTQWVVFEPNDRPLWARVRQTVTNFLTTQWRNGALQGKTADEAFFVRCDETTMTQDDIDNGRLICEIGIAPVKPAEFVIFRIQQKTLELQS